MKPGDRKRRWRHSQGTFAVVMLVGLEPPANIAISGFFLLMAFLEARDGVRGWPLKERRPPWADRFENRSREGQDNG